MKFLKTFEGRLEQDRSHWRAAKESEPDVANNLSRVPALGKEFNSFGSWLQKDPDHRRNAGDLDHPQIAHHAEVVRGMWPRGRHGGAERGCGSLGEGPSASDSPTHAPGRGQPRMPLVTGAGRVPSGMPRVHEIELERSGCFALERGLCVDRVAAASFCKCLAEITEDL